MRHKNIIRSVCLLFGTVFVATTIHAAPITGLFNTGVDDSGNALAAGSNDLHYSIVSTAQPAVVIRDNIPASWFDNTPTSRWIWQSVSGLPINVTLTFRTTFDLTGFDASTAAITGQWATDNSGLDILINGATTGNTCGGFSSLCDFSIGSGFVSGINNLDFIVKDTGVISGLHIASISGTADLLAAAVPEPSTLALFAAGLFGLGFAHRKRMK